MPCHQCAIQIWKLIGGRCSREQYLGHRHIMTSYDIITYPWPRYMLQAFDISYMSILNFYKTNFYIQHNILKKWRINGSHFAVFEVMGNFAHILQIYFTGTGAPIAPWPGPCITNVFATRRKNFSQWHRSFQRKLLSHWLKFLRHVAITLVIQGPVKQPWTIWVNR